MECKLGDTMQTATAPARFVLSCNDYFAPGDTKYVWYSRKSGCMQFVDDEAGATKLRASDADMLFGKLCKSGFNMNKTAA